MTLGEYSPAYFRDVNRDTDLEITPLGAAIVEALPDREKVRRIKRNFREHGVCPTSAIFDADAVRAFYAERGQRVTIRRR